MIVTWYDGSFIPDTDDKSVAEIRRMAGFLVRRIGWDWTVSPSLSHMFFLVFFCAESHLLCRVSRSSTTAPSSSLDKKASPSLPTPSNHLPSSSASHSHHQFLDSNSVGHIICHMNHSDTNRYTP